MPRTVPLNETLRRYWALLVKVPRAPRRVDAGTLHRQLIEEGFDVHLRSVQRDLEALALGFAGLRKDARHKPFAWYWDQDAPHVQFPVMGLASAVTFDLARRHLERALPRTLFKQLQPTFDEARRAVASHELAKLARWPQKVRALPRGYPLKTPELGSAVMDVVYDALLNERRFLAVYKSRNRPEPKEYEVSPLGLVLRDGIITLVCCFDDNPEPRHMVLHRMRSATALDKGVKWPRGFDLERHIADGALGYLVGRKVRLVLRLEPNIANQLEETPLSDDQRVTWRTRVERAGVSDADMPTPTLADSKRERWVRLEATVNDSMELRGWLRSLGPLVEVQSPAPLRRALADDARALAALYASADST